MGGRVIAVGTSPPTQQGAHRRPLLVINPRSQVILVQGHSARGSAKEAGPPNPQSFRSDVQARNRGSTAKANLDSTNISCIREKDFLYGA